MRRLPARFAELILCFAPLFFHRSWRHAELLLVGAILAPGQRTVAGILRITGLAHERRFANCHRIVSRAAWTGGPRPRPGQQPLPPPPRPRLGDRYRAASAPAFGVWADITGAAAAA